MNKRRLSSVPQQGAVLVIALIMLLITTLIAISAFEMGGNNLIVVSNLEGRGQAQKAAEAALEIAVADLSLLIDSLGTNSQRAVYYCQGKKNHRCYDINGDGQIDIEVDLANPLPQCIRLDRQRNNDLDPADRSDQGCFLGAQQVGAVDGATSAGMSMCSNAIWDIWARAVDLDSQAEARVRQGVGIRVSINDTDILCP